MFIFAYLGGGTVASPCFQGGGRHRVIPLFLPLMNTRLPVLLAAAGLCLAATIAPLRAQNANSVLTSTGGGASNSAFVIKSINIATPSTPEFTTVGSETQAKRYTLGKWLEIETEFSSTARSSEVNFKYFVVIGDQMLTGDETLLDVPVGQSLFTVMYVAPRTLTTLLKGQPLNSNSVVNVCVQIARANVNTPAALKVLKPAPGPFYNTMPQVTGFVLAKPNTPFANLWWDRYEQVKAPTSR